MRTGQPSRNHVPPLSPPMVQPIQLFPVHFMSFCWFCQIVRSLLILISIICLARYFQVLCHC